MAWRVETFGSMVDAELDSLPADMRAKVIRIAELLKTLGIAIERAKEVT